MEFSCSAETLVVLTTLQEGGPPLHQSCRALRVRLWSGGAPCQRGREPQEWAERTGDVPDNHATIRSTLSWGRETGLVFWGWTDRELVKCPVLWQSAVMISALGRARARGWARHRQRYGRVSAEHRRWSLRRALLCRMHSAGPYCSGRGWRPMLGPWGAELPAAGLAELAGLWVSCSKRAVVREADTVPPR